MNTTSHQWFINITELEPEPQEIGTKDDVLARRRPLAESNRDTSSDKHRGRADPGLSKKRVLHTIVSIDEMWRRRDDPLALTEFMEGRVDEGTLRMLR